MRPTRIGCLSGTGIITALLTLLIITGVGLARGGVLFSPGELSAVQKDQPLGGVFTHAETGGRCAACHPAFWEQDTMTDRCLVCHLNLLQTVESFHAVMLAQSQNLHCKYCHTEHLGAEASLTVVQMERFPHNDASGFSLQSHQQTRDGVPFLCVDCHGAEIAKFKLSRCLECHQELERARIESHAADFSSDCLACHDGLDTYGARFEHELTSFPLLGEHANTGCAACHAGARAIADLKTTRLECAFCHNYQDPHAGKFGRDCALCHTPEGWENVTFDHSLAAFPLTGAHAGVPCSQCHLNGQFLGLPVQCAACHLDPGFHQGAFGLNCAGCHDVTAWIPAQFEQAHRFPLDHGAPGKSSCRTCHPGTVSSYTCYGCHEHDQGNIERKHREEGIRDFNNCVRCHPTGREEEGEGDES